VCERREVIETRVDRSAGDERFDRFVVDEVD
jgi:hypothetical protein